VSLLSILVVGAGIGGQLHLKSLYKSDRAVCIGIVAPADEANISVARAYGIQLFNSISECVSKLSIDGVIIASPNSFHLPHFAESLQHGLPTLIEKPLADTIQHAFQMLELSRKYPNIGVLVGHHRAHSSYIKHSIDIINSGTLGDLVSFMGSAQYYKPNAYFEQGQWRSKLGGGPILINMIHEVDILRRLVGEIISVSAYTSHRTRGFEVEDTCSINFEFANGVLGTFILSDTVVSALSWELTSRENPAYPAYPFDCYILGGTRGSLSIPTMTLSSYPEDIPPSWWAPLKIETTNVAHFSNPIDNQLIHFLNIIDNHEIPKVTVKDGLLNQLVCQAINKSANIGQRVLINSLF
jgi:predicted dehydrogenase